MDQHARRGAARPTAQGINGAGSEVIKGSYVLILALGRPTALSVGRLGAFCFPAGTYAYAGSALGPGGLAARLAHHRRLTTSAHWHIDYLRRWSQLREIWSAASNARLECAWARALLDLPGAQAIAPRFGASDCRCATHLVYFARPLSFAAFVQYAVGTNGLQREVLDAEAGC